MPGPRLRPVSPQPEPQPSTAPRLNFSFPQSPVIWRYVQRYTILTPALDTTSLGDIPLPPQGLHAKIYWSASDTSANASASFGGMQIAVNGGAVDIAGHYSWTDVSNTNGGGPVGNGLLAAASWGAFVTTGGGTGAQWASNGRIYLERYSDPTQQAKIWWDTAQINSGAVLRRMGAGYFTGAQGAVTKLHFFSGAGNLATGTFFELWVAMPAS